MCGAADGSIATQFDEEQTKSKLILLLLLSDGHKLQPQDVIFNAAQVVMAFSPF